MAILSSRRFTGPVTYYFIDPGECPFNSVRIARWSQTERVRIPTGGKREVDATTGQVVDNGPFLIDPDWIVQGQNDASGSDTDVPRLAGNRRSDNRRIGKESTKAMEMAFRDPYCLKSSGISDAAGFTHKPVPVLFCLRFVRRKEHKA